MVTVYLFLVSEDEAEIVEDLRINGEEEATTNYTTGIFISFNFRSWRGLSFKSSAGFWSKIFIFV